MRNTLFVLISLLFFSPIEMYAQNPAVTETEALSLAACVEAGLNNGDASLLNGLIDPGSFAALLQQKSEEAKDPAFMAGFMTSMTFKNFGNQTMQQIRNGHFRLLRSFEKGGQRHLLFRAFGAGINYFDFTLVRVRDSVKASDVLPYITGELMSSTMANITWCSKFQAGISVLATGKFLRFVLQ